MVDALSVAVPIALAGAGLAAILWALSALSRREQDRRYGALVSLDLGPGRTRTLSSELWRLSGRPDEVREDPAGRPVPVEHKSRTSPARGPPDSHIVQLWAYCALLEEEWGVAPPYGILRYSDGGEFQVRWSRGDRARLAALRAEMAEPYDGRARPSPARCARCRWWSICDVRAA